MKVIGLTGRERVGKGTVAEMAIDVLRTVDGCYGKVEGFADRLKISAARALGYDGTDEGCIDFCDRLKLEHGSVQAYLPDDLTGPTLAISGREYLQRYGTEAHREVFADDFWVDAVLPPTLDRNDCDVLIVHDVRFPNEAERVREYGGEVWSIVRPGFTDTPSQHASQQPVAGDAVIDNCHGLEWLRAGVVVALEPTIAELQERQQTLEVPR